MTGPAHYSEAERLLNDAACGVTTGPVYYLDDALPALAAAQVHATLALAAAMAADPFDAEKWKQALQ